MSGCANGEKYSFSGSDENWSVVYTVEVSDGVEQQTSGVIEYIGEGKAPETIDYKIEYKIEQSDYQSYTAGDRGETSPLKGGVLKFEGTTCGNCAIIQKDEEILAEIGWSGKSEEMALINIQ
ncbi:hypothetical protein B0X71_09390 [Planococcus lenghuensis]|uniref:Uncharacterized protein n=1 Tax=Planococcus lenghuensis TaxID=2213202 RepID=A0A1Q2L3R6_9BACL|nr:hypothetical protein B0X71_09390 [Planococcus lenghuensis]